MVFNTCGSYKMEFKAGQNWTFCVLYEINLSGKRNFPVNFALFTPFFETQSLELKVLWKTSTSPVKGYQIC